MRNGEEGDDLTSLKQQTVLAKFGELALTSDDLDEILTEACRLIGEALGTDLAKVMELQPDGQTLLVRAGVGWKPGVIGQTTVQITDDTSEAHALKTGEPMISLDIATETRFRYPTFLIDHGVKAVANVAIIGAKNRPPFGILQIDSREPRAFNDGDIAFLRSYANLVAAAVERLRAIHEARYRAERLRLALDAGELGSWELDLQAGTTTRSPRHDQIFGYANPLPAWTIDMLLDHVVPEDRTHVAATFQRAVDTGTEWKVTCRIHRAGDGEVRWIEIQGQPERDRNHSDPTRLLGIIADITVREAAEDALRQSQLVLETMVAERTKALVEANDRLRTEASERERVEEVLRQAHKMEALGQLTGGIAHDFNNMLQAIGSSLELVSRRVEQGRSAEAARLVDNARTAVERAASLTNRLLAFARRQALQPRLIEPDALVRDMLELIQHIVGSDITVKIYPGGGLWTVLCDPNQLENVLINLAVNARDAMPTGGTFTISTQDVHLPASDLLDQQEALRGNYVEIAITDTGIGMDETTRMRAFEPFFTTKPIGQGTGLGLSQVYGFVRQSGGVVRLDSVPGRGTTVRLLLPRQATVEKATTPAVTQTKSDTTTETATILLVEDEAQVRTAIAEILRELGYQILEAGNGLAALHVLQAANSPHLDLLVTDVGLPGGLNGRQVADAARATRPDLPVLFITGYAGVVLEEQLSPGMTVMGKPFTLEALADRIQSMIKW